MTPKNSPTASERPDRPWLFPLVLLLVATAAIVALTLTQTPLPNELEDNWMFGRDGESASYAVNNDGPWGGLWGNLALACAHGLYALPVLGMAGILAAGGFDWGLFAMLGLGAALAHGALAGGPQSCRSVATGMGALMASALFFGGSGWLFAGRRGWRANRAALLNLPLGFAFLILIGLVEQEFLAKLHVQPLSWLAVPVMAAVMLGAVWWLLRRSAAGRQLRAIGGDGTAARIAGVKRGWPFFVAFALSAVGAVVFGFYVDLLGHPPFDFWRLWLEGAIGIGNTPPRAVLNLVFAVLAYTLPFVAIAACGGGLFRRGRVSPLGLVLAALAVPMLDCAICWHPGCPHWLRGLEMPLLIIVGWRMQRARG